MFDSICPSIALCLSVLLSSFFSSLGLQVKGVDQTTKLVIVAYLRSFSRSMSFLTSNAVENKTWLATLGPPVGSVKLIFTKVINLESLE